MQISISSSSTLNKRGPFYVEEGVWMTFKGNKPNLDDEDTKQVVDAFQKFNLGLEVVKDTSGRPDQAIRIHGTKANITKVLKEIWDYSATEIKEDIEFVKN